MGGASCDRCGEEVEAGRGECPRCGKTTGARIEQVILVLFGLLVVVTTLIVMVAMLRSNSGE